MNGIESENFDRRMHDGWRCLEKLNVDGWMARFAGGVTTRANSVLPMNAPKDMTASLRSVEREYLTPVLESQDAHV
jgi:N-acetylglutamate synthase